LKPFSVVSHEQITLTEFIEYIILAYCKNSTTLSKCLRNV
jgi:hypothetical protein